MNKKILVIAFAFFLATTNLFAQEKSSKNFFWGPKVGVDLATPTTDEATIRSEVKSNFQAGLFFQFGKKVYLQPELYYATRKENINYAGTIIENKINSLRLPVLVGANIFNLGVVSGRIMAGPQATYILDENMSIANAGFDKRNLNWTLTGGAGVTVIDLITLDVRYSVDLGDNTRNQIKQLSLTDGVNVTLGLKF